MKLELLNENNYPFDIFFFESVAEEIEYYFQKTIKENVSLSLIDDAYMLKLNFNYVGKNTTTDVLSFPMDSADLLGDIAISIDTAKKQAEEYGNSIEVELAFLFIHGVLHLLGYDHEESKEAEREMYSIQDSIILQWAQKNGYK